MKKLLLLLTAIAFFSCSDDDNGTAGTPLNTDPALVGEWVATDIIGQTNLPDCLSNEKFKFRLSGKFYHTVSSGYDTPCTSSTYEGTYTVHGDIITFDSPGGVPIEFEIVSLTATKLQLKPHFSGISSTTEYTKQ